MTAVGKNYLEFEIIRDFFMRGQFNRSADVVLGPGDDCAIVTVPEGSRLAYSIDTQVAGIHFPELCPAEMVAYRSLGSSVSDLAAMGAKPHVFTLAMTIPETNTGWLTEFSTALAEMANSLAITLVGGDLTRGPLAVTVQVTGILPAVGALTRSGARVDDDIYVSGTIGDAGAGLQYALNSELCESPEAVYLLGRYCRPQPRVELGQKLLTVASAAIDISDGLVADLTHITRMSGVGAKVEVERLPLSPELDQCVSRELIRTYALSGGDDYELCFTAAPEFRHEIEEIAVSTGTPVSRIGHITSEQDVECVDREGELITVNQGYQHFGPN